ncbi:hypothetical protein TKK_0011455 [Trichogramma kaykai]|uniref:Bee-milk protein n=1 Tax=Trichogramma kaykai TaxID=54128 RepID=A0ABD2WQG9_9HYME
MYRIALLLLLISSAQAQPAKQDKLRTIYEWKYLDYEWQSKEQKDFYVKNGLYDPRNMTPIDVDYWNPSDYIAKTFVTVIRQPGVPASVHTVSNVRGDGGYLLKPYPDWTWYDRGSGCNGIISTYRVAIDRFHRLWVLDTGKIGRQIMCPAKLLVFDLITDKLISKMEIPLNVSYAKNGEGLLVTPIVETFGRSLDNVTVYMADVQGFGMVVLDPQFGFHRLEADVFGPEQSLANFEIADERFDLPDGVLGMALGPRLPGKERILAFRPLASRSMYAAHTQVLLRSRYGDTIKYYRGFNVLPSQASAMAFSDDGILFYGLTSQTGIGCWHVNAPMDAKYFDIALIDRERLQFVSGMKVINKLKNGKRDATKQRVYMMSNRLQKIYNANMNFNEVNFRITSIDVDDLARGTSCEKFH